MYSVFERVTVVILEGRIMNDFYFSLLCLSIFFKMSIVNIYCFRIKTNFVLMKKIYIYILFSGLLVREMNKLSNEPTNKELPKQIKWLLSHLGFGLKITFILNLFFFENFSFNQKLQFRLVNT